MTGIFDHPGSAIEQLPFIFKLRPGIGAAQFECQAIGLPLHPFKFGGGTGAGQHPAEYQGRQPPQRHQIAKGMGKREPCLEPGIAPGQRRLAEHQPGQQFLDEIGPPPALRRARG